ncbi:hypothetical protein SNEBB_008342, partial [Seison nebaliae]
MMVSGMCAIGYFLCVELFPTSIRGFCFGICTMVARVGAFLAPQILFLSKKFHPVISFLVLAILGIIAAVTTSFLPRTTNLEMAQTVHEAETLYKEKCTNSK